MVCLHTGTMGVHPACFFINRAGKVATLERNRARKYSSYLVQPSFHRAPTGGRQAFFSTTTGILRTGLLAWVEADSDSHFLTTRGVWSSFVVIVGHAIA